MLSVGGDPAGGYIVEIMDGDTTRTFSPVAANDAEAIGKAVHEFGGSVAETLTTAFNDPAKDKALADAQQKAKDALADAQRAKDESDRLTEQVAELKKSADPAPIHEAEPLPPA